MCTLWIVLFYLQHQNRILHTDPCYRSVPRGLPGRRALNNTNALLHHQFEFTFDRYWSLHLIVVSSLDWLFTSIIPLGCILTSPARIYCWYLLTFAPFHRSLFAPTLYEITPLDCILTSSVRIYCWHLLTFAPYHHSFFTAALYKITPLDCILTSSARIYCWHLLTFAPYHHSFFTVALYEITTLDCNYDYFKNKMHLTLQGCCFGFKEFVTGKGGAYEN